MGGNRDLEQFHFIVFRENLDLEQLLCSRKHNGLLSQDVFQEKKKKMIFSPKIQIKRIVCIFLVLPAFCVASTSTRSHWPEDFMGFYKSFRALVIAQNYADITKMTCFPFKAFNLTETLDTVPYKKKLRFIGKAAFEKNELAKYFLTQAGDITSDTPVIENGITTRLVYLYENNAQLIAENEDPQSLKKLRQNSFGYEPKTGTVFVSGLEFSKKKNGWCWSYASYMRDDKDKW